MVQVAPFFKGLPKIALGLGIMVLKIGHVQADSDSTLIISLLPNGYMTKIDKFLSFMLWKDLWGSWKPFAQIFEDQNHILCKSRHSKIEGIVHLLSEKTCTANLYYLNSFLIAKTQTNSKFIIHTSFFSSSFYTLFIIFHIFKAFWALGCSLIQLGQVDSNSQCFLQFLHKNIAIENHEYCLSYIMYPCTFFPLSCNLAPKIWHQDKHPD